MKKNKMMRIASAVMMATLLSTCVISGTFAKYTTSNSATDTARVAKWGVEISVTGETDTFKKAYDNDATPSVEASGEYDVVAPGTEGNFAVFAITGTPEVDVAITYTATVDLGDAWLDANSAYYCPLEITVGADTLKGTTYTSVEEFEAAVVEKIVAHNASYDVNTNLAEAHTEPVISWKWAFTGNDDEKDTDLGDAAANNTAPSISITVNVVVEQTD